MAWTAPIILFTSNLVEPETWRFFLLGVLAIFVTAALGFSGEAAKGMAETRFQAMFKVRWF